MNAFEIYHHECQENTLTTPDCIALYKQDISSFIDLAFPKGLLFAKHLWVHHGYAELGRKKVGPQDPKIVKEAKYTDISQLRVWTTDYTEYFMKGNIRVSFVSFWICV